MVPHENSPIENMTHAMINALIGQYSYKLYNNSFYYISTIECMIHVLRGYRLSISTYRLYDYSKIFVYITIAL